MAARCFEDLVAWQLANELKQKVYALIDASAANRDVRFCDQLRDAVSSAPANLAEGFAYYHHPQFARHVRIAKASLDETRNHLKDGVDRRHFTQEAIAPLLELADSAVAVTGGLLAYLTASEAPSPWGERRKGRRRRP